MRAGRRPWLVGVVALLTAASFALRAPCLGPGPAGWATLVPGCRGDLGLMWDERGLAADALLLPENRDALAMLGARLATQAELYEASARGGTPALSFRSAWAVLAAAGIYGDIAREVRRRGARAWDARVSTGAAAKLGWIARAWGQARGRARYAGEPRPAGLWGRERR